MIKDSTDYTAYKEFTISKAEISSVTFTEPTVAAAGIPATATGLAIASTANYTGEISWFPADASFGYNKTFTATVTVEDSSVTSMTITWALNVHSDVKEEHSAPEAVRAAEEMFLPLNIVEQDKTGVNRDHFGIVPDKAYNLTAYVTIQGFVSAINKIEKANPKANTVSIYTGKPFTFNKRIVETIQKGGKTIIYYFYHKGHLYSVTVPATVDASKVLEKAGFAGPLYVGKQLSTTKLVK